MREGRGGGGGKERGRGGGGEITRTSSETLVRVGGVRPLLG